MNQEGLENENNYKIENWRRTAKPVLTGGGTWRTCRRKMKLGSLEALLSWGFEKVSSFVLETAFTEKISLNPISYGMFLICMSLNSSFFCQVLCGCSGVIFLILTIDIVLPMFYYEIVWKSIWNLQQLFLSLFKEIVQV